MLRVRLARAGKKNLPSFRIEVTEGEKIVDLIGSYYPHATKSKFSISKEKLDHWLKSGAKPTPAVADLIKGKYEFKPYYGSGPAKAEEAAPAPETAPISAPVESPASEEVLPPAPENPAPESSPEEKKEVEPSPQEETQPNV